MIRKKALADQAMDYLWPYFEHKQYIIAPEFQFRRMTSFGHVSIICQVAEDETDAPITFFLGVRHHLIEEAMAGLFGQAHYYRTDSHTLLIDQRHLLVGRGAPLPGRMVVNCAQSIASACDAFIAFMDRKGFAFFDKYRKLQAIDHLFNEQPSLSAHWCNNHYQRCFRGMFAASILKRNDLEQLRMRHRIYLGERGYSGSVIQKFDAIFTHFGNLSLN